MCLAFVARSSEWCVLEVFFDFDEFLLGYKKKIPIKKNQNQTESNEIKQNQTESNEIK